MEGGKINFLERISNAEVIEKETIQMLKSHTQGDHTILKDLFDSFNEDAGMMCDEIISAAGKKDFEALRKTAHSLSGTSGSVGAEKLKELSRIIENAVKKQNYAEAVEASAHIKNVFLEFRKQLREIF